MDWDSDLYCGIRLTLDYIAHTLDISMPGYILKQLQKYKHTTPTKPQHCPYAPQPKQYGARPNNCSPWTRLLPSPMMTSNRYNARLEAFCIMPKPSTSRFSWPVAQFLANKQMARRTPCSKQNSSSTT